MQQVRKKIEVNGTTLDSLLLKSDEQSENLVVIAHGFGGKPVAFMPLAEELVKNGMDVLLYAQRGHFFSDNQDSYRKQFNTDKGLGMVDFIVQNIFHSDFSMEEAVKDHIELIRRHAGDYKRIGQFGFSSGATISAKSLEDPVVKEKTEGLYFASPYLSVDRLKLPEFVIQYMRKNKESKEGLLSGISSLALYDLDDIDVRGKQVYVAIARDDEMTRSAEDTYKFAEKGWKVRVFPGNHVFIAGKADDADLYFGKAAQRATSNKELYFDILSFFSTVLGK